MTAEPIDLDQMVSWARHEGYAKLHVVEKMAMEIERLRTELGTAHLAFDLVRALADDQKVWLNTAERDHEATIAERDYIEEMAADLAYAVAPFEVIGEWSSHNNPIANAIDIANHLRTERDAALGLLRRWSNGLVPVGDYTLRTETDAMLTREAS